MLTPSVRISPLRSCGDSMQLRLSMIAIGCAIALSACGIKGPLYLPDIPPAPAQTQPATGGDHSKQPSAN
ncbi:MAG: lipoprotein [Rhodocyclales bacterium]|nr:lipoprotein [Rhodocyclales bacterium]